MPERQQDRPAGGRRPRRGRGRVRRAARGRRPGRSLSRRSQRQSRCGRAGAGPRPCAGIRDGADVYRSDPPRPSRARVRRHHVRAGMTLRRKSTEPTMGSSMMRGSTISKLIAIVAGVFLLGAHAMAADGLTTIPSSYGPKETMDRLEAEIKAKGMTVFARIDHAAGAAQAGPSVPPTEGLLFGNAKAGTPLMQANHTIGIHRPMKSLGWQDGDC